LNDPVPPVVSTDWLAARLGTPGLRVVDASWYLPGSARDAAAEYRAGHIPGAIFFDIDATSDQQSPLPHMLPAAADFAARMSSLGLSDSDMLVIYDGSGANLSAGRVWWTFRTFGHERVAVLDGGMKKWRSEQRLIEEGPISLPPGNFTARLDARAVRDLAAIRANIENRSEQLVDVRSRGRFQGAEPEPRPGLRPGHVPGSINLPYTELVSSDGTLLPPEALRRRLAEAGVDVTRPIVATCGSGTSACALVLGLHSLGHTKTAVYDGAWSEWGARADTPVETHPPPNR
jgi:thiosulfate/3-mercaptopyruvate sulfurtransferase